jgi:hypothetical protein
MRFRAVRQQENVPMLNTIQYKSNQVSGTVFAASRQVWLAGLGAAVVTRDWAEREAGQVFRTLVKEGTAVESKAFRIVGDQVESSMTRANVLWKKTRATVETTVRAYADTAGHDRAQIAAEGAAQGRAARDAAGRPRHEGHACQACGQGAHHEDREAREARRQGREALIR